jgi:hypothetical protein
MEKASKGAFLSCGAMTRAAEYANSQPYTARKSCRLHTGLSPNKNGNFKMTTGPVPLSPAAERMRLHRERRRQGLRCLTIELRETEIDALVRRGLLIAETRHDGYAVRMALYEYLDDTLDGVL